MQTLGDFQNACVIAPETLLSCPMAEYPVNTRGYMIYKGVRNANYGPQDGKASENSLFQVGREPSQH